MYSSIGEIKDANRRKGHHYFDRGTMRFFNSRTHSEVYGGRFFVTSEKGPARGRAYTVRLAMPDGSIETASDFQEFDHRRPAHRFAQKLAELPLLIKPGSEAGGSESFSVYAGEHFLFWTYDFERAASVAVDPDTARTLRGLWQNTLQEIATEATGAVQAAARAELKRRKASATPASCRKENPMPETAAQLRPETLAYLRDLRRMISVDRHVGRSVTGPGRALSEKSLLYWRARMRRETAEQIARSRPMASCHCRSCSELQSDGRAPEGIAPGDYSQSGYCWACEYSGCPDHDSACQWDVLD